METLAPYLSDSKAYRENGKLPSSLSEFRDKNISELEKSSIPHRKVEDWKYTHLSEILKKGYHFPCDTSHVKVEITKEKDSNYTHIYFENGILNKNLSDKTSLDVLPLHLCVEDDIINFIQQKNCFSNDFSNILNQSNLSRGYIFKLAPEDNKKPLFIHHHFSGEKSHYNINNVFLIKEMSTLHILEEIKSSSDCFINFSTKFINQPQSHISHTLVQDLHTESLFLNNLHSEIQKDAFYKNIFINKGSKISRSNISMELTQTGAHAQSYGLYDLQDQQHCDTLSCIKHIAPETESHQLYKGILSDESKGIFTGKIHIAQEAQRVTATQLNKNLLLSSKAQIYSQPQLEIYADDVSCTHGSTTGELRDEEIFYFEARGIKRERAKEILAKAFAYDITLKVEQKLIEKELESQLSVKNVKGPKC